MKIPAVSLAGPGDLEARGGGGMKVKVPPFSTLNTERGRSEKTIRLYTSRGREGKTYGLLRCMLYILKAL